MKLIKFAPKKHTAQAMVEFAIVLPILLLLLYGILEAGRLLFMYSSIVTASRQAVRYGSATGIGTGGVFRYQDCAGIRLAAQKADFLNAFDDEDIFIYHDEGPNLPSPIGKNQVQYCLDPAAPSDTAFTPSGNSNRLVVEIKGDFNPIVRLVPFIARTVANGNPITARSARTILTGVSIQVTPSGSGISTTTTITTSPNPSEPGELVTATVTVTSPGGTPAGTVVVSAGGIDLCTITLSGGTGSCSGLAFDSDIIVEALFIPNDLEAYAPSSDGVFHDVTQSSTLTTITDSPNPSVVGSNVNIKVTVTNKYGGSVPTGTVDVNVCGTLTLDSSGKATCNVVLNSSTTIDAHYSGDTDHFASEDHNFHEVMLGTATASNTPPPPPPPTATFTPFATAIGTATYTPSPTLAPVDCTGLTTGNIVIDLSENMTLTINNPHPYPLTVASVYVVWNHDRGHKVSGDKTLELISAAINTDVFWTDPAGQTGAGYTINPTGTVVIPPGNSTIIFTFHQTYLEYDTTEEILINLSTPGCEAYPIHKKW